MKVKELIRELQQCNPDATVYVYDMNNVNEPIEVYDVDDTFVDENRVDLNFGE